jgi:hypothetical protein
MNPVSVGFGIIIGALAMALLGLGLGAWITRLKRREGSEESKR